MCTQYNIMTSLNESLLDSQSIMLMRPATMRISTTTTASPNRAFTGIIGFTVTIGLIIISCTILLIIRFACKKSCLIIHLSGALQLEPESTVNGTGDGGGTAGDLTAVSPSVIWEPPEYNEALHMRRLDSTTIEGTPPPKYITLSDLPSLASFNRINLSLDNTSATGSHSSSVFSITGHGLFNLGMRNNSFDSLNESTPTRSYQRPSYRTMISTDTVHPIEEETTPPLSTTSSVSELGVSDMDTSPVMIGPGTPLDRSSLDHEAGTTPQTTMTINYIEQQTPRAVNSLMSPFPVPSINIEDADIVPRDNLSSQDSNIPIGANTGSSSNQEAASVSSNLALPVVSPQQRRSEMGHHHGPKTRTHRHRMKLPKLQIPAPPRRRPSSSRTTPSSEHLPTYEEAEASLIDESTDM